MTSYIIRRLLLIIPTMVGITFMIFMLVALSPGGVGAALQAASGQMESTDRARQEAYLEERYGLKDPVVVQYLRWLGRVSPIKFGTRDQVKPDGEVVRPPKALQLPVLAGEWYGRGSVPASSVEVPAYTFRDLPVSAPADAARGTLRWLVLDRAEVSQGQRIAELVPPESAGSEDPPEPVVIVAPSSGNLERSVDDGATAGPGAALGVVREDRGRSYRRISDRYARSRAAYVGARADLEEAIRTYANWGADRIRVHNDTERRLRERRALLEDPGEMSASQLDELRAEIVELDGRLLSEESLREAGAYRDRFRGAVDRKNNPQVRVLRRAGLDDDERGRAVVAAGERALAAYEVAVRDRAALLGIYGARPFRQAGFWVVPGYVSVATPDLGVSFSRGTSVVSLIGKALPVTLMLNAIAFPIIYMLAVPTGLLAAVKKGRLFDHVSGAVVVGLWSIPTLVASVLMVGFLARKTSILGENAFPTGLTPRGGETMLFLPTFADGRFEPGLLLSELHHMVLPLIAFIYPGLAVLTKQTRAAMLDNFSADYVRTAKAKGVSGKDVIFRHVLRNSLLPLITLFAAIFPAILGGSVVIERVFDIDGMGSLIIEAINLRDRELLLANVVMITCVNLLALLLADILYAVADPRISYS